MEVQDAVSQKNKTISSGFGSWCKKHKKEIVGCGIIIGTTILGFTFRAKMTRSNNDPSLIPDVPEHDFGRDLVMKFFDKETGEPYKEEGINCTEEFAKDMYDISTI